MDASCFVKNMGIIVFNKQNTDLKRERKWFGER